RLLLEQPAQRGRASKAPVDRVEHLEQALSAVATDAGALASDQLLELGGDHLTEQALARAEPSIDRRPPDPQLACDDREIHPLAVDVLSGRRAEPLGTRGACRPSPPSRTWCACPVQPTHLGCIQSSG